MKDAPWPLAAPARGCRLGLDTILRAPALARLLDQPRVRLARWPTPIHTVTGRASPEVRIKRDDLCGYGRGGAKARKIEHLIGYMLAHCHDELITVAGNITNLAFDLPPALDRFGIRCQLLIADDPPTAPAERARIFHGIENRVRLLGRSRGLLTREALRRLIRSRRRGGRPLLVLPGLSHPAAVVGNACGFIEMANQMIRRGDDLPAAVFVTAATGTTLAGFLLAAAALRHAGAPSIPVVGVQVYPGRVAARTRALMVWSRHALGLPAGLARVPIRIDRSALDAGFGRFSDAVAAVCQRVRTRLGLRLDPIFGGKTWLAMERWRDRAPAGGPILYWHCGYTPEWRSLTRRLR